MCLTGLAVIMTEQRGAALRALLFRHLIPRHKRTFRIIVAAQKREAALGFQLNDIAAAFRAVNAGLDGNVLGVFAVRISGARQKLAESAGFDDHVLAALFADFIGHFVFDFDALPFEILLCLLQCCFKSVIETAQNLYVADFSVFNFIQLFFHVRGKFQIRNRLEFIDKQLGDALAERCRLEASAFLCHIIAFQNRRNGRRIGRRSADTLFFHRLDERCFSISCRRLGEMLCRCQLAAL